MSLELALAENTATMRELILVISQAFQSKTSQASPTAVPPAAVETNPPVVASTEPIELAPIDYKELASMVTALTKTKGKPEAIKLLAEFGAKNLKEVPVEQYAEVATIAKMMLEA